MLAIALDLFTLLRPLLRRQPAEFAISPFLRCTLLPLQDAWACSFTSRCFTSWRCCRSFTLHALLARLSTNGTVGCRWRVPLHIKMPLLRLLRKMWLLSDMRGGPLHRRRRERARGCMR